MIIDFATSAPDDARAALQADIVIVGAGAAGITLARQLLPTGMHILLLESGGPDHVDSIQNLYEGRVTGTDYYELRESRLRFFGGTTAIWGGRCARLDAIDFARRDWVEHSGWPLTLSDLDGWYAGAQASLGLPAVAENRMPGFSDPLEGRETRSAFWQFDEQFSRFSLPACKDLQRATTVTILLNASLVGMTTTEDGRRVIAGTVSDPQGRQSQVSGKQFVLATGGLENPRILLSAMTPAHPNGIGNNRDQVGRYFMEHPHARGARITSPDPERLFRTFPAFQRDGEGQRYGILLRPSEVSQAGQGILNTCFTLGVYRHEGEEAPLYKKTYGKLKHDMAPGRMGRALWQVAKKTSRWVQDRGDPAARARLLRDSRYGIYAVIRAEQAPNPESRVRLAEDRDALGMPKIELDWQLKDIDKRSVLEAMMALDRDLRHLGLGEARPCDWLHDSAISWKFDHLVTGHPYGGYHHMGTTRMGDDPTTSVVDADCRVHGMDNLYIAGSSVFPTGGWANPTLTIIALAMRLGDHIQGRLST